MLSCTNLLVEYKKQPLGLDIKNPRFSWQIESDQNNTVQTGYQITVTSDGQPVWNSGVTGSSQSIHVEYGSPELKPSARYDVTVRVWDNHGQQAQTSGSFETGLLSGSRFIADWITHSLPDDEGACPVFRRQFSLDHEILKARIYASSLGIYEINLNGQRVGDAYFTPGWTSYQKRLQYQAYDVTDLLGNQNTLEMTVANGWYKGVFGLTGSKNNYGDSVAAILELHVDYSDGTKEIIKTDEQWAFSTGPIRYSEIYHGETIASNIQPEDWFPVTILGHPKDILLAQESEYIRIVRRLAAKSISVSPKGETIVDFGQNMAGFIELNVNEPQGREIAIRHAEILDTQRNLYTENLRSAKCTDTFICKGGEETFRPHFTYHGFRYIAIDGLSNELKPEDVTACVLHTDMMKTGEFACSNELINQLQHNIEWSQRSNFFDIPTDCPQRDERLGWTGDVLPYARTACFNFNVALMLRKWLHDLAAEQTDEFGVPYTIPNLMGPQDGVAAWSDCATAVPWILYICYGDKQILGEQYDSMKGWVEFVRGKAGANNLWQRGFQYGDWLAIDKEPDSDRTATDRYFIASAFYANSTDLLRRAAKALGKTDDYKEYSELYDRIVSAFRKEYVTETGRLVSESQTGCLLALAFDLIDKARRPRVIEILKANLIDHRDHLTTGFVGTPLICHVLSENGLHDFAGKLMLHTDYPSWLYAVTQGATTIWERWNGIHPDGTLEDPGMNSFNHFSNGAIGDWLYSKIAGINAAEPAYKKIRFAPMFIKGITYARGVLQTLYGKVSCEWHCEKGLITVDICVPANCTAEITLPEKEGIIHVGSGTYHYEYATTTNLESDHYCMDMTLEQLMDDPAAIGILENAVPDFHNNPIVEIAKKMTLTEISAHDRRYLNMFEQILAQLNQLKSME